MEGRCASYSLVEEAAKSANLAEPHLSAARRCPSDAREGQEDKERTYTIGWSLLASEGGIFIKPCAYPFQPKLESLGIQW